jgi:hypothetical protein
MRMGWGMLKAADEAILRGFWCASRGIAYNHDLGGTVGGSIPTLVIPGHQAAPLAMVGDWPAEKWDFEPVSSWSSEGVYRGNASLQERL